MNLSSYASQWKFNETREAILEVKSRDTINDYGADTVLLDVREGNISPFLIVYKDDVIEFKLVYVRVSGEEVTLSPIGHRTLKDFREEFIKYIGSDAYDYGYKYSLNLDVQDYNVDSIMFSKEEQFYEFLTLVNKHKFFSIN